MKQLQFMNSLKEMMPFDERRKKSDFDAQKKRNEKAFYRF